MDHYGVKLLAFPALIVVESKGRPKRSAAKIMSRWGKAMGKHDFAVEVSCGAKKWKSILRYSRISILTKYLVRFPNCAVRRETTVF